MPAPSPPPVVHIAASLDLEGVPVELAVRVLVAGVVPEPRFGREAEVAVTAGAVAEAGADMVDVSLAPRLIGPAVRAVPVPVAVRVGSGVAAAAAGRAGAALLLVPVALLPEVAEALRHAAPSAPPSAHASRSAPAPASARRSPALVALVDDLPGVGEARAAADRAGVPLAFDSSRVSGAVAIAREAAAVAEGCRILRTADVRRSRRVAEVMTAILAARREPGADLSVTPSRPDDEGLR